MTGWESDDSPPAAEVVANSDGGPNITVLENQESLVSMNNWLEAKTLKISTTVMHENREAMVGPRK